MFRRMGNWLRRLLLVLGGITLWILVMGVAAALLTRSGRSIEPSTVLEIDLGKPFREVEVEGPVEAFLQRDTTSLRGFLETLERASEDERIIGLVADVGSATHGMAVTQEVRDAIAAFRGSGKFAVAFATSFGELGPGNQPYYLATAFDEIWLQPSGTVGLTGLAAEVPFVREALEKLSIEPRFDRRGEFKNAVNSLTETEFTDPHRVALEALLSELFHQIVTGISDGRGLGADRVQELANRGPFLADEAAAENLVDRVGYRDEALRDVTTRAPDGRLLFLRQYRDRLDEPESPEGVIAFIPAIGTIMSGESESTSPFGEPTLGAETLSRAIREAAADEEVDAILLRIDSPGGSYVASDTVWRETVRAREAGKPLVVSMGNVAASGGYFIAAAADRIVAEPGTITGSIGVFAGKAVTRDLWQRIGVSWGTIYTSENADMWSTLSDFDPVAWKRFQRLLDAVYEDFVNKVAEGREMEIALVDEHARGRVWSGADARSLGLVDDLGGLTAAVRIAATEGGLDPDAPVELRVFSAARPLWEQLLEPRESSLPASVWSAGKNGSALGELASSLGLRRPRGILSMPWTLEIQ